jgi:hypothetical protein
MSPTYHGISEAQSASKHRIEEIIPGNEQISPPTLNMLREASLGLVD